jgi:DNA-binding MarR family transcriptional regulator
MTDSRDTASGTTTIESASHPSPPVMRTWFRFLRLHQTITTRATQELRTTGLSIPQFDLLSTVWEREGVSQQEIAERLYVTKGNVSGLVDRLGASGLMERRSLPHDRRSHALYLTDAGRAVVEQGFTLQNALVGTTLGALSAADQAEMERLLILWRDRMRDLPKRSSPASAARDRNPGKRKPRPSSRSSL